MYPFGKGVLKPYILSAARHHPVSGMDIIHNLDTLTTGRWKPSPGSVYPIFKAFEKQGLLKKATKGKKEVKYVITKKGLKVFEVDREECFTQVMQNKDTLMPVVYSMMGEEEDKELEQAWSKLSNISSKEMNRLLSLPPKERAKARRKLIITVSKLISYFIK